MFLYINNKYLEKFHKNEDRVVFDFFSNIKKGEYLEVGSGLGRFVKLVKDKYNFNITCVEINKDLAKKIESEGFNTINKSILQSDLDDRKFDIVHCSHIIEHFSYPDIVIALDELLRIIKQGGYVIIRSPLLHSKFYNNIDHIKPYPPEAVLNYFNTQQQQKRGKFKVEKILIWYRRTAIEFRGDILIIKYINIILKLLWINLNFPFSKRNGYILILRKR